MEARNIDSNIKIPSIRTRLALSFSLLTFLVVGLLLSLNFLNLRQQLRADLRQRLLNIISLAALQQDGDAFVQIQSPQDPAFERIRLQNLKIRYSDPELRFVYTMRYDEQGIYFVVDAVEPNDPLGSPYGTRYFEPGPVLEKNYRTIDSPMAETNFYTDEYGTFISAYAPFYTLDGKFAGIIGADITASNVLVRERQALQFYLAVFLLAIPLVALSGWFLGNRLAIPITSLTQAAVRISKGEIGFRPDFKANSAEIALLKNAFYSTADQLQSLIGDLERRVTERTKALDRRAAQLQAAADVGAAAVRLLDLNELLKQATLLISERFGFYHVGIFLLDERGENAVLRAANSEGGQRMLERGHRLKVGQVGIVGYVTALAEPRIALDVGKDAVFFDNPDLPNTRSEMALPLLVGDRIFGALDVQSTQEAAFSEEDISTLRVLANQISIAIDNARLFAERQSALDTTRRAFGEISRIGWQRLLGGESSGIGYTCTADSLSPISSQASPEFAEAIRSGRSVLANSDKSLHLPIKVRDEIIGAIRLDKGANQGQWTKDDISMANALSEQLGTALESARLFQETSRRATRERAVSEITTHFRRTTDPQDMIRTALEELRRVLGAGDIRIHPYYPGQEDKNEENKLGRDDLPTTSRF